jgi:hypothetical protein
MCFSSPSSPPPAPPPPAPAAPAPLVTMAPAEGVNRKDAAALSTNRGRSSLRIDRTVADTGSSGSGLNIPV